jgi:hypothetical protein
MAAWTLKGIAAASRMAEWRLKGIVETVVCAVLRIPPLLSARKTSVPPNGTRASGTPTAMPFDVARPLVAMPPVLVTRRAGSSTRVPYPRGTYC